MRHCDTREIVRQSPREAAYQIARAVEDRRDEDAIRIATSMADRLVWQEARIMHLNEKIAEIGGVQR